MPASRQFSTLCICTWKDNGPSAVMHLLHHPRDYTEFPAVVDFIRDDTNPVRLPVRSRTRRTVRSFASSSVFVSESRRDDRRFRLVYRRTASRPAPSRPVSFRIDDGVPTCASAATDPTLVALGSSALVTAFVPSPPIFAANSRRRLAALVDARATTAKSDSTRCDGGWPTPVSAGGADGGADRGADVCRMNPWRLRAVSARLRATRASTRSSSDADAASASASETQPQPRRTSLRVSSTSSPMSNARALLDRRDAPPPRISIVSIARIAALNVSRSGGRRADRDARERDANDDGVVERRSAPVVVAFRDRSSRGRRLRAPRGTMSALASGAVTRTTSRGYRSPWRRSRRVRYRSPNGSSASGERGSRSRDDDDDDDDDDGDGDDHDPTPGGDDDVASRG